VPSKDLRIDQLLTSHSDLARHFRNHGPELWHGVLLPLEYETSTTSIETPLTCYQDTTRTILTRVGLENETLLARLYIAEPTH
jgi:hypothetical protein